MSEPEIVELIEFPEIYDGWSVAVMSDGTFKNRWADDDGTSARPGYERRWLATERYISLMKRKDSE